MAAHVPIRVRIAAGDDEARRLAARFSRAGMAAAADDGSAHVELMVALRPRDLADLRPRSQTLLAVGSPAAPLLAAGADDVVPPGEPELLFRRVVAHLERLSLLGKVARSDERARAFEEAMAEAAHDVRSPLHAAVGHATLLATDEGLTNDQRGSAQAAARQAERALQLAERVMASAVRAERVPLRAKPVDVAELLDTAASAAEANAQKRGISLEFRKPDERIRLRADGELLGRLLDNLIANALRHTRRSGKVEVGAWRVGPRAVRLSVRDTGDGIPEAALHKLTAGLGSGRGLRICREIAERHGGDLWAESTVGEGSTFYVELPLNAPNVRPRVLLVSDDGRWAHDVALALREACDVRMATTAGAKLRGRRPDLVLVETPSPGQERRLLALRHEAHGAHVPVVELPQDVGAARLASALARLGA